MDKYEKYMKSLTNFIWRYIEFNFKENGKHDRKVLSLDILYFNMVKDILIENEIGYHISNGLVIVEINDILVSIRNEKIDKLKKLKKIGDV